MVAEIGEACSIITAVIGKTPRLYRPPVGLSNPHVRTALEELDMECIGWNRSLGDGGNRFTGKLNRMPALARAGSVIMLHDCLPDARNRDIFLKNLRALCEHMKARELVCVGVGELFGVAAYREDS